MPENTGKSRIFYPVFFFILLFLAFLSVIPDAVRRAICLCGQSIIPSLFPFLVLSKLLTAVSPLPVLPGGRLFSRLSGLPAEGFTAFLIGALCGFPLGAQITADLYCMSALSRQEAERLSFFCNNVGPAFAVGAVGTLLFGSARIGWFLYGIQMLSALLCLLLQARAVGSNSSIYVNKTLQIPPKKRPTAKKETENSLFALLPAALGDSAVSLLGICGAILFFSALCALPRALLPPSAYALLAAVLEIGNGTAAAAGLPRTAGLAVSLLSLSFGGLSVFMQTAGILRSTGLSPRSAFRGKCMQSLFSLLLFLLLFPLVRRL